jgi:hypothetical protein
MPRKHSPEQVIGERTQAGRMSGSRAAILGATHGSFRSEGSESRGRDHEPRAGLPRRAKTARSATPNSKRVHPDHTRD